MIANKSWGIHLANPWYEQGATLKCYRGKAMVLQCSIGPGHTFSWTPAIGNGPVNYDRVEVVPWPGPEESQSYLGRMLLAIRRKFEED